MGVMERRREGRYGGLTFEKGGMRMVTVQNSEKLVWNIIAVKVMIYSRKFINKGVVDAVKKSVCELKKKNSKIYGEWLTRRLLDMYYFETDTVDEFQLSENMANIFFEIW